MDFEDVVEEIVEETVSGFIEEQDDEDIVNLNDCLTDYQDGDENEEIDDDSDQLIENVNDHEYRDYDLDDEDDEFDEEEDDEDEFLNGEKILDDESSSEILSSNEKKKSIRPTKSRKKAIDEEEAWLQALEEGRLHEVDDELKKIKDPKLMTARQRSLFLNKDGSKRVDNIDNENINNKNINTRDNIEKKLDKARKRKQQAEEKKEKDRKTTIDRLLNKKSDNNTRTGSGGVKGKQRKKLDIPRITYINNKNGAFLCFGENVIPEFEVFSSFRANKTIITDKEEKPAICAVENCFASRKYTCSKSGLSCCSLKCYKLLDSTG